MEAPCESGTLALRGAPGRRAQIARRFRGGGSLGALHAPQLAAWWPWATTPRASGLHDVHAADLFQVRYVLLDQLDLDPRQEQQAHLWDSRWTAALCATGSSLSRTLMAALMQLRRFAAAVPLRAAPLLRRGVSLFGGGGAAAAPSCGGRHAALAMVRPAAGVAGSRASAAGVVAAVARQAGAVRPVGLALGASGGAPSFAAARSGPPVAGLMTSAVVCRTAGASTLRSFSTKSCQTMRKRFNLKPNGRVTHKGCGNNHKTSTKNRKRKNRIKTKIFTTVLMGRTLKKFLGKTTKC